MKKQILILVFLVLATFASVTKSYGQNELVPTPAVEYTYGVTLSGVTTTATDTYNWYITQDLNLLDRTKDLAAAPFYTVAGGTTSSTIKVTWLNTAAGKTFYLVAKVTAQGVSNTVACTVDNYKSYEIQVTNRFVLTASLANANGSVNTNAELCAKDVSGATVTARVGATAPTVAYSFGVTTLYYKIKAEGMLGVWNPAIKLDFAPAMANGQVITSVKWSTYDPITPAVGGFADFAITAPSTLATFATIGNVSTGSDVAVTLAGSYYLVEVTITNNGYETLANQTITLSIDGLIGTDHVLSDAVSLTDPTSAGPFAKNVLYTVTPRPTVTETVTSFITKNP